MAEVAVSIMASSRPPITSVKAGTDAAVGDGDHVDAGAVLDPLLQQMIDAAAADDAIVHLPGLAFARSIRSLKLAIGESGATRRNIG